MGRIQIPDIGNLSKLEDVIRFVGIGFQRISQALNGGITLTNNLQGQIILVTFQAADTNTRIIHNLDYVPSGYIVIGMNTPFTIYDGNVQEKNVVQARPPSGTASQKPSITQQPSVGQPIPISNAIVADQQSITLKASTAGTARIFVF